MLRSLYISIVLMLLHISSTASAAEYRYETIATNLNQPWSVAFLPNGDFLLTLRVGELRRVSASGEVSGPLKGVPETYYAGQGGFFDVVLDPEFARNQTVFLSYAAGTPDANGTRVSRGTLDATGLTNLTTIFDAKPSKDTAVHYGGRMVFLDDGTLIVSTGDGFEYREAAQDRHSHLGKIIRLNRDGSVPADNPYADGRDGDPLVYSYGHRNTQGLVLDTDQNVLYMHEHGARGGDELNIVEPGANYGWPVVTLGINYSGAYVSPLQHAPGVVDPVTYWVPSIAPSGLAYYSGDAFADWQGDLFVGALVDREVRRLDMKDGRVVAEIPMFQEIGERIRDIRSGPDGYLYILTDGAEGQLIRVVPAPAS